MHIAVASTVSIRGTPLIIVEVTKLWYESYQSRYCPLFCIVAPATEQRNGAVEDGDMVVSKISVCEKGGLNVCRHEYRRWQ